MKRKSSQEILSDLEARADGLPVRRIGTWTLEKLAILLLYFQAFTSASAKAEGGTFVDGFAGPGLCEVRGALARPKYVWGSPLIAMRTQPPFQDCLLIELKRQTCDALRARVGAYNSRAEVRQGDVNEILPEVMHNRVHPKSPCFCLLDPEGMELLWQTVEGTATTPRRRLKPELLILFHSGSLMRLLPRGGSVVKRHEVILDRMMPTGGWRAIYEQRLEGRITPAEAKDQYVELYRSGVEELGYTAFSHPVQAPTRPGGTRRERYQLVFATQHPAGEKIMTDVFRRPYILDFPVSGQPPLFED